MNRDLLWILNNGQAPAPIVARSVIEPLDVTATPMRARFHTGVNMLEIFAGIAVLVLCFHLTWWWLWLLLAALIGGSVFVRFHWSEMTIDDSSITVVRHRPFRLDQTQVENRTDYVSLSYRSTVSGRARSFNGTLVDALLEPARHVLFLRHKEDYGRDAPLFWTTDWDEIAEWQAKLSAALGVPVEEMASAGQTMVAAEDLTKPLAIRVTPDELPDIDLETPPQGISVIRHNDTIFIQLPDDTRSRMGKRVATAILALPLLVPFAIMAPLEVQAIFGIMVVVVLIRWKLGGEKIPLAAHRITLDRHKGIRLHFPRLYWPSWRTIGWTDLMAVENGRSFLIFRDRRDFWMAGEKLPTPDVEWLRSFITSAATTAVHPSTSQEKTSS